ncbi:MAG: hypothetical protein WCE54_07540 [Ignavibacteriaceae bacterium]
MYKILLNIIFFLTAMLFVIGCKGKASELVSPVENNHSPNNNSYYYPGEVIAGFVDSVSYQFALSFLNENNIEPKSMDFDSSFSIWLQIERGDPNGFIKVISRETSVSWVEAAGYPFDDVSQNKKYLLAHFNGSISLDSTENYIKSLKDLIIKKIVTPPKSALLKVEIGKEMFWVDSLNKYDFIRYAELNYLTATAY